MNKIWTFEQPKKKVGTRAMSHAEKCWDKTVTVCVCAQCLQDIVYETIFELSEMRV